MIDVNIKTRMSSLVRGQVSKAIYSKLDGQQYFDSATYPLSVSDECLREHGYRLIDEDGSDLGVILCGDNGRGVFDIGLLDGGKVENVAVLLSWYKMPSGRYEVVSYLT